MLRDISSRISGLVLRGKLYWGMILVVLAGAAISPIDAAGGNIFLSVENLTDVLRQVSITGIVAVGMTFVVLTGGIDLAVGSIMALCATLIAMLLTQRGVHNGALAGAAGLAAVVAFASGAIVYAIVRRTASRRTLAPLAGATAGVFLGAAVCLGLWPSPTSATNLSLAIAMMISVGACAGLVSGVAVAKGGVQPFIATLAMMVGALGLARVMAGPDQSVYPIYTGGNAPLEFEALRATVAGIPVPGIVFVVVALLGAVLLGKFRIGREIYAVGGNEKAAHLAGINVARVKTTVYVMSGVLAGIAGLLYAAQYRQGKPDAGTGLELDAIAAVVIGGASLAGGKGTILGTVVGVFIFGCLTNIFQLANIDSNAQLILKGAVILAAVLVQNGRGFRLPKIGKKQ